MWAEKARSKKYILIDPKLGDLFMVRRWDRTNPCSNMVGWTVNRVEITNEPRYSWNFAKTIKVEIKRRREIVQKVYTTSI